MKKQEEFKIIYTRGTGPGGQHKNKVETCVVITHVPSGMKEKCEDTRSRDRNEKLAMARLLRRIEDEKKKLLDEKKNDQRKELIKNKGNLRTYNYPRNEVVDHRTGKRANLKKVMDGDLDLLK